MFKKRKTGRACLYKDGKRIKYQSTAWSFRLPVGLALAIDEVAKREGVTRGACLVSILEMYLASQEKERTTDNSGEDSNSK